MFFNINSPVTERGVLNTLGGLWATNPLVPRHINPPDTTRGPKVWVNRPCPRRVAWTKASEKPAKRNNAFLDGQTYFTWHSVAWGKWNSGRFYHSKKWIPNSIEVILRSIKKKKRLQIREGVTNGDLGQEGKHF